MSTHFATTLLASLALVAATPMVSAATADASFVVVHGIPGRDVAPTLDPLLPVDVLVDNHVCLLQNLTFGEIAGPFDVRPGRFDVKISLADVTKPCGGSVVIDAGVTLKAGQFASLVAQLSTAGAPAAGVFKIDASSVAAGSVRFETAHAADAPAVRISGVSTGSGAERGSFAFDLAPGAARETGFADRPGFELSVAPIGGKPIVGPVPVMPGDRGLQLLYVVGSAKSGSTTVLSRLIPSVF